MFSRRKRIRDLEETVTMLECRTSCLAAELRQLQKECVIPGNLDKRVATNIYFDEGLSKGGVISQAEYNARKYNVDIEDVTFHELAQYVLAGTPIHRERRTIVANPGENPPFHKSDILCTKSEDSEADAEPEKEK